MKAYKGTYNGKCKDITYEIGKTYTYNGKIEMCKSGFHFCLNSQDIIQYYPYKKDLVVFEIEVEDNNYTTKDTKSVTNSFKVIKKVSKKDYPALLNIKLDSKGNKISYKNSKGFEVNSKYDSKGNLLWSKNSKGFEWSIYIK